VDQIIGYVQIVSPKLIEKLLLAQPVPTLVQVVDVRITRHPIRLTRIRESFHPKLNCCGLIREGGDSLVSRNPLEAPQGLNSDVSGWNHDFEFTRGMKVVDFASRAHPMKRIRRHVTTSVGCMDLDASRHCPTIGS
jgi:hypothetical protein